MRLDLTLHFERPFLIPYNYPRYLYSFLLRAIELHDEMVAKRIHNNRRDVKFVASKFLPVGKVRGEESGLLVESGTVRLLVGSTETAILGAILNGLGLGTGKLHIKGQRLLDFEAQLEETPKNLSGKLFRTLSPVSVYHNNPPNGFRQWDLSPVGHPNSPFENEPEVWKRLVFENLRSKYMMVYGEPYERDFEIEVSPKSVKSKMFRIKRDNKTGEYTKVRAWEFEFRMWGEERLLRVAYNLGLGMRNAHGFGMIEVI